MTPAKVWREQRQQRSQIRAWALTDSPTAHNSIGPRAHSNPVAYVIARGTLAALHFILLCGAIPPTPPWNTLSNEAAVARRAKTVPSFQVPKTRAAGPHVRRGTLSAESLAELIALAVAIG